MTNLSFVYEVFLIIVWAKFTNQFLTPRFLKGKSEVAFVFIIMFTSFLMIPASDIAWLRLLYVFTVTILSFRLLYLDKWKRIVLNYVIILSVSSVGEMIIIFLMSTCMGNEAFYVGDIESLSIICILHFITTLLGLNVIAKYFGRKKKSNLDMNWKNLSYVIIFGMIQLVLVYIIMICIVQLYEETQVLILLCMLVVNIISYVMFSRALRNVCNTYTIKNTNEKLKDSYEAQLAEYLESRNQEERMRILRHDMLNQIEVMNKIKNT